MGRGLSKLGRDDSGREGSKQNLALALIVMLACIFIFRLQPTGLANPDTVQENAAVTVVILGENQSTPDKLNVDDGDNYQVLAEGFVEKFVIFKSLNEHSC